MRTSPLSTIAALAALSLAACSDATTETSSAPTTPSLQRDGDGSRTFHEYGKQIKVGNGHARSYLVYDGKKRDKPVEVGVALDEKALEGLPTTGGHAAMMAGDHGKGHHGMSGELLLSLPDGNPTQYKFVELNWNPSGHEPEGIYTVPHFDFHFYTITKQQRDAIDPADPAYATRADNLPTGGFVPQFNVVPAPPGVPASALAVPRMGVHWSDVRSPELQGLLGNPAGYRPFTATFIYGSWNGNFIFNEPMITRAFLLTKPDVVLSVGQAADYTPSGYYPSAYRIQYDAKAKEYRIGLTQLTKRG